VSKREKLKSLGVHVISGSPDLLEIVRLGLENIKLVVLKSLDKLIEQKRIQPVFAFPYSVDESEMWTAAEENKIKAFNSKATRYLISLKYSGRRWTMPTWLAPLVSFDIAIWERTFAQVCLRYSLPVPTSIT
jgi:hypothetical protein